MNELDSLFPKDLYHTYIIEGDADIHLGTVRKLLESRGEIEVNSPDVFAKSYDAFTVADGADIKGWHSGRAMTEFKKVCIIGARFINREAEHALLKMFEEPHPGTHFFLIIPDASMLLDTIRSRAHVIRPAQEQSLKIAHDFISSSLPKRLDAVAMLIEKHKDKEGSGSLRYEARELINGIERCIYQQFQKDMTDPKLQFSLAQLQNAREYLGAPGCSVKMIVEHIALVI